MGSLACRTWKLVVMVASMGLLMMEITYAIPSCCMHAKESPQHPHSLLSRSAHVTRTARMAGKEPYWEGVCYGEQAAVAGEFQRAPNAG